MKNFLFVALILFTSCTEPSNKQKELELKEKELQLREREINIKEKAQTRNPSSDNAANVVAQEFAKFEKDTSTVTTSRIRSLQIQKGAKFVYVLFKVSEPKLFHRDSETNYGVEGISSSYTIPEYNKVSYVDYIFTSQIQGIASYDEDRQYEYMDQMEVNVRDRLTQINMNFESDVSRNVTDKDEQKILKTYQAKIVDRKIKIFNSYKEASIFRNSHKGEF